MINPKTTRKQVFEREIPNNPMVQFPVDLPIITLDLALTSLSLTVK
jgi:hypothetical protein